MKLRVFSILLFAGAWLCPQAYGQWKESPTTGSPTNRLPDRTTLAGQAGAGVVLKAELLDRDGNAKKHRAVVHVETDGVRIVNSAAVNREPKLDEAHIQYRLDDGPVKDSTSKSWTFENIPPGKHRIHVNLATSDDRPLGKGMTFSLEIP